MIDLKISYKKAPDVLFHLLDQETVLLDLKNETYFQLNKTGTDVWTLLQEYNTFDEIKNILSDRYAISPEILETDLRELFGDLLAAGIIIPIDKETHESSV